jgi:uncharacterized membrane protein
MLRWQARLDAGWADRVLPWLVAGAVFVWFVLLALARARSAQHGTDLASSIQGAWMLRHGHSPDLTITSHNLFADQLPLAFYPLAMVTGVFGAVPTLLAVQSFALASGVVPVWRLARTRADLRVGATGALAVAYALSPAVNNLNLADFHQEALALPALIGAAFNGLSGRWWRYAPMAAFVVLCRADLAIVIFGLGVLLLVEGKRRAGTWTMVGAAAWLLFALLVLERILGQASLVAPDAFAAYGNGAVAVVRHVVTNPIEVLSDLAARDNLDVIILLLAPLLFLPLLAPKYLFPAVPLQALYLVADVPTTGAAGARYTVAFTAFSFVAAAFALSHMGRRNVERVVVDRRLVVALVIASAAFFAGFASNSPYEHPWAWGGDEARTARADAADLVPTQWRVRASAPVLPYLAERRVVYALASGDPPIPRKVQVGVDAIVVDASVYDDWSGGAQADFAAQMAIDGYRRVFSEVGVMVFLRQPAGS